MESLLVNFIPARVLKSVPWKLHAEFRSVDPIPSFKPAERLKSVWLPIFILNLSFLQPKLGNPFQTLRLALSGRIKSYRRSKTVFLPC